MPVCCGAASLRFSLHARVAIAQIANFRGCGNAKGKPRNGPRAHAHRLFEGSCDVLCLDKHLEHCCVGISGGGDLTHRITWSGIGSEWPAQSLYEASSAKEIFGEAGCLSTRSPGVQVHDRFQSLQLSPAPRSHDGTPPALSVPPPPPPLPFAKTALRSITSIASQPETDTDKLAIDDKKKLPWQ